MKGFSRTDGCVPFCAVTQQEINRKRNKKMIFIIFFAKIIEKYDIVKYRLYLFVIYSYWLLIFKKKRVALTAFIAVCESARFAE